MFLSMCSMQGGPRSSEIVQATLASVWGQVNPKTHLDNKTKSLFETPPWCLGWMPLRLTYAPGTLHGTVTGHLPSHLLACFFGTEPWQTRTNSVFLTTIKHYYTCKTNNLLSCLKLLRLKVTNTTQMTDIYIQKMF